MRHFIIETSKAADKLATLFKACLRRVHTLRERKRSQQTVDDRQTAKRSS